VSAEIMERNNLQAEDMHGLFRIKQIYELSMQLLEEWD